MWVRSAAIRPVPPYAHISLDTIEQVEASFGDDEPSCEAQMKLTYAEFERRQPALSKQILSSLQRVNDETATAIGYFLALIVFGSFQSSFGVRLRQVSSEEFRAAVESFKLDEALRRDDPDEPVDTDDVISMEQPNLVAFIREHVDLAMEVESVHANMEAVDKVYRVLLLQVLVLSHAVHPPEHAPTRSSELQA